MEPRHYRKDYLLRSCIIPYYRIPSKRYPPTRWGAHSHGLYDRYDSHLSATESPGTNRIHTFKSDFGLVQDPACHLIIRASFQESGWYVGLLHARITG